MPDSISSNVTGLRIAAEETPKVLPGTPVWKPREPNGYSDFGGTITRVSRNPINQTRQRKKGVASGVDAAGGYGEDFTETNFLQLLQGFFVADAIEKTTTIPITDWSDTPTSSITGVTTGPNTYTAASGLDSFKVGDLVLASNFGTAANNGVKEVTAAAAATLTVSETLTAEASPPANAKLQAVGFRSVTNDLGVDASGNLPIVTAATTDLTTLGIVPGEWVYFPTTAEGGFQTAANSGYARVNSVTASQMVLDKTQSVWVTEAATANTVDIYLGTVLRNATVPAEIVRRYYQLERTLGDDGNGTQSQYILAAEANEISMSVPTEDKITADISFVGLDVETRDGTTGVKSGTRPALVAEDAYNTSNDFARIRMEVVDETTSFPTALFAFGTEFTFTLNNNITANKAVGTFGAFSTNLGELQLDGSAEVYFALVSAIESVRNNADVSLDLIWGKGNAGWALDIPLLSLGDARPNIEQNQPIKLPLELEASESAFNHTVLMVHWPYLPNGALAT